MLCAPPASRHDSMVGPYVPHIMARCACEAFAMHSLLQLATGYLVSLRAVPSSPSASSIALAVPSPRPGITWE